MLPREVLQQVPVALALDEHHGPMRQQRNDLHALQGAQLFEKPELLRLDEQRRDAAVQADPDASFGRRVEKLRRMGRQDELHRFLARQPRKDAQELVLQPAVQVSVRLVQQHRSRPGREHRRQDLQRLVESRTRGHDVPFPRQHPVAVRGVQEPVHFEIEAHPDRALREELLEQSLKRVPARAGVLPQIPQQVPHHLAVELKPHPVPAGRQGQVLLARQEVGEERNEPDLPSADGLPPAPRSARGDVEAVVVHPKLEADGRVVVELRPQGQGIRPASGAHPAVRPEIRGGRHRQDAELVGTHGPADQRKLSGLGAVSVGPAGRFDAVLKQGEREQDRRLAAVVGADQHGHVVEVDDRLPLEALEPLDGEAADHSDCLGRLVRSNTRSWSGSPPAVRWMLCFSGASRPVGRGVARSTGTPAARRRHRRRRSQSAIFRFRAR